MSTVRITGVENTIRALKGQKKADAGNIAEGLDKYGGKVLTKAQYYCPKDTLKLVESGQKTVTGQGLGAQVSVAFGGEQAPYAVFVHENMEATHAAPTCAKFLTRAVRETRSVGASILKRQFTGAFIKHDTAT